MPIYTYTTFDDPLATGGDTQAWGINDAGQIVGFYEDSSLKLHGFLYSNGTYTTLDDPSASANGSTKAFGINATGQMVGDYINASGFHGFLYDPNSNIFPPSSPSTTPRPPRAPMHSASTTPARSSGITRMPAATTASS